MSAKQKKVLIEAIEALQEMVTLAYGDGDNACLIIKGDDVEVIGDESDVLETNCTATRALDRLLEDSGK